MGKKILYNRRTQWRICEWVNIFAFFHFLENVCLMSNYSLQIPWTRSRTVMICRFTFSCRPASRSPSWETCDIPTDTVTLHSVYPCFCSNNSPFGIKVQGFTDVVMIKSTVESHLRLNYWSWKIIYRFKLRITKFYKSTGHMLHWEQLVCNSFPLIRRHYSAQRFCQRCLKVMICDNRGYRDRFLTFSVSYSFPRCREVTLLIIN